MLNGIIDLLIKITVPIIKIINDKDNPNKYHLFHSLKSVLYASLCSPSSLLALIISCSKVILRCLEALYDINTDINTNI